MEGQAGELCYHRRRGGLLVLVSVACGGRVFFGGGWGKRVDYRWLLHVSLLVLLLLASCYLPTCCVTFAGSTRAGFQKYNSLRRVLCMSDAAWAARYPIAQQVCVDGVLVG